MAEATVIETPSNNRNRNLLIGAVAVIVLFGLLVTGGGILSAVLGLITTIFTVSINLIATLLSIIISLFASVAVIFIRYWYILAILALGYWLLRRRNTTA